MTEYSIEQNNYLAHHGVLGMKWGVRKYQNADGSLTSLGAKRYGKAEKQDAKAASSKIKLKAQYHAKNAAQMRGELKRGINVKNAKGLRNKASEAFGYGADKTKYEALAKGHANAAKYTMTKTGKRHEEVRSYNAQKLADYSKKMQNASTGKKVVESMFKTQLMKTSMKTLSGRRTTYGQELALTILTGGLGNKALDVAYRVKENKAAKSS